MNDEPEGVWEEAVMTCSKVLARHLPGGIEEKHGNPRSGYSVRGRV
jgi:hypothetical protein